MKIACLSKDVETSKYHNMHTLMQVLGYALNTVSFFEGVFLNITCISCCMNIINIQLNKHIPVVV